jgi:hypothetical protein
LFIDLVLAIVLHFLDLPPNNLLLVQLRVNDNLPLLNRGGVVPDVHPRLSHFGVMSFKPFLLPLSLEISKLLFSFDLRWRESMPLLLNQKEFKFRMS